MSGVKLSSIRPVSAITAANEKLSKNKLVWGDSAARYIVTCCSEKQAMYCTTPTGYSVQFSH